MFSWIQPKLCMCKQVMLIVKTWKKNKHFININWPWSNHMWQVMRSVVGSCSSSFNTLQNFCLHSNFRDYDGSHDLSFLCHLLVISWFQTPFLNLTSHSHLYLYIVCVIFGNRDYHFSCKGNLFCLKGKYLLEWVVLIT